MLKIIYIGVRLKKGLFESLKQASIKVGFGILGDTHSGELDRQISIYVRRDDETFVEDDGGFCKIRFKPNLVLETINPLEIHTNDRLKAGDCELEITVAGKECHPNCPLVGKDNCDFQRNIYFTKVVKSGEISLFDKVTIER